MLNLPPTDPKALLYVGSSDGGLGLPRLSDQVNLRKWSIAACRLQERGGLLGLAVKGLLSRTAAVSGGRFVLRNQRDFIGHFTPTPVWGSSLGALGPNTLLSLSQILGQISHPLLRPLTLGLFRLEDHILLRTLHRLSTRADAPGLSSLPSFLS